MMHSVAPPLPGRPARRTRDGCASPFVKLPRMPTTRAASPKAVPVRAARDASGADSADLVALLTRIAKQDHRALAAFYDTTAGRVYGLALRIARSEALAEEISGDVYLQVWKNAASYNAERGHPLAWLMVMTRSRALDQLRRVDPAESHAEPELLAEAVDENDPRNLLAAVQEHGALHAALAALPAVQRQLLALAFFQGLTHSEIAAHTRMPLGTVKTHVRRALQALRTALETA